MRRLLPLAAIMALASAVPGQGLNVRLKDPDGKRVELSDLYQGRPLVVNFWATWCKPCCRELEQYQKLYQAYADSGVGFLGICVNEAKDQGKVKAFLAGNRYGFPVALDPEQQAMRKFGLKDVPGSFVIGKDGRIAWSHYGFKPGDEALMEEEIRKHMKRPAPDSSGAGQPSEEGSE